jgi:PAS domain S-box-containing protein
MQAEPTQMKLSIRQSLPAWTVFGIGLLVTVFVSLHVKLSIEQEAASRFAFVCDQVVIKIQERLGAYDLILRGGAALFAVSNSVTRQSWRTYVEALRVGETVPGVQGVGFAQVIPSDQLASHIARIRGEGFPDYAVRPTGERAIYTSIIYLEPFRDRNLRAFGYDMFSEPVRRAAMEQARDTGEAALSGKVLLVQETSTDVQAGVLLYVPVYRRGAPVDSVEHRRAALTGWAYIPYRMKDLMTGILLNWEEQEGQVVDLHIYDGSKASEANLLFDSKGHGTRVLLSPFRQQRSIDFRGHVWRLEFDHAAMRVGTGYATAWATLIGGLALSAILFVMILLMLKMRISATRIEATNEELALQTEEKTRRAAELVIANEEKAKRVAELVIANEEKAKRTDALAVVKANFEYTRSLIEASLDPLVTISPEGKITDVNAATEQVTGAARSELVGSNFADCFSDPVKAREGYQQVFSQGTVIDYPLAIRHASGKLTDVLYNARLYRDDTGKVRGVFAAARDITERKRAEDEVRKLNTELEQRVAERTEKFEAANKELEAFAYSVSHDLRAPLRAIDGFSRKVVTNYADKLDDEGRRQLRVVRDEAQRMGRLIDDLLSFSRMGRREIALQPLDMDALVRGVADELRMTEPERSIEFAFAPLPQAPGDFAMLRQVWANLLGNAVKFTRQRPVAHIEVGGRTEGGEAIYWVKDNGAGFDMRYANKLFGVFQRLHRQDEFEGTGVGLAIAQRILHRHNGHIRGEGKPDAGAVFTFALPLTHDHPLGGKTS